MEKDGRGDVELTQTKGGLYIYIHTHIHMCETRIATRLGKTGAALAMPFFVERLLATTAFAFVRESRVTSSSEFSFSPPGRKPY